MKKKKGVIYARVSTTKDEQKSSLDIQEESLISICNQKNIEIVNTYTDTASGTRIRKRKGFISMLYEAGIDFKKRDDKSTDDFQINKDREPLFDFIICKDVFRFGRNSIEAVSVIKELKDNGITVYFINAGFDTADKDYKLRIELLFTMAENESHNTSQRIKYSKRQLAKLGRYSPSRLPYGFSRIINEKGEMKIIIDEDQAKVVRFIFEQYPNMGGHIQSKLLNEKGIKTQQGHKWTNDKITRIINNTAYYGCPIVQKWTKNDVTDMYFHKADESRHLQLENVMPAIVTRDEFEKAQAIKKTRTNSKSNKGKYKGKEDVFYNKVLCKQCGSRFVRHSGNNNKVTYMCQNRRKFGIKVCDCKGIAYNSLVKFINQSKVKVNEIRNGSHVIKLKKNIDLALSQQKSILETIQNKINELEQKKKEIALSFVSANEIVREVLNEEIKKYEIERTKLINQKKELNPFAIEELKKEIEQKERDLIQLKKRHNLTFEEKIKLLKNIKVCTDFVEISYSTPNYLEVIEKFNQLIKGTNLEIKIVNEKENANSFYRNKQILMEQEEACDDISLQKEMEIYLRDLTIEEMKL